MWYTHFLKPYSIPCVTFDDNRQTDIPQKTVTILWKSHNETFSPNVHGSVAKEGPENLYNYRWGQNVRSGYSSWSTLRTDWVPSHLPRKWRGGPEHENTHLTCPELWGCRSPIDRLIGSILILNLKTVQKVWHRRKGNEKDIRKYTREV